MGLLTFLSLPKSIFLFFSCFSYLLLSIKSHLPRILKADEGEHANKPFTRALTLTKPFKDHVEDAHFLSCLTKGLNSGNFPTRVSPKSFIVSSMVSSGTKILWLEITQGLLNLEGGDMEIPKTISVNKPLEVMRILALTPLGGGAELGKTWPQGFTTNKVEPGKPLLPTRRHILLRCC